MILKNKRLSSEFVKKNNFMNHVMAMPFTNNVSLIILFKNKSLLLTGFRLFLSQYNYDIIVVWKGKGNNL